MGDSKQRLLITGASGQLARLAAELFVRTHPPDRLVLVSRNPRALAELETSGATVRYGDFADPDSLPDAFAGCERMLLVSTTDLDRRVRLHGAAIDAAVAAGIGHVIYTSGLSPAPPNPAVVAPSHHATEQRLAAAGISWTVLRNSLYAEYVAADAARAIETGQLIHNWGEGVVAHVSRVDCAAAAVAVLAAEGHENLVYDITGPQAHGAKELARLFGELSGRDIEAVALDDAAFVDTLVGDATDDDHLKYGASLVASFGRSIRAGFMASCTDTVQTLTGSPARPLRDVLRESG